MDLTASLAMINMEHSFPANSSNRDGHITVQQSNCPNEDRGVQETARTGSDGHVIQINQDNDGALDCTCHGNVTEAQGDVNMKPATVNTINMDCHRDENQNMYPQPQYPMYGQQPPSGMNTNVRYYQTVGYPQQQPQFQPGPYTAYPQNQPNPPQNMQGYPLSSQPYNVGQYPQYYNQGPPPGYGAPYQRPQQYYGQPSNTNVYGQPSNTNVYGRQKTGNVRGTSSSTDPAKTFWGYTHITQIEFTPVFEDPKVRQAFIRKVYTILTLQLLFCSGVIFACIYVEEAKTYLKEHPGVSFFFLISYMIVNLSTSCCCPQMFVIHPFDFLLMFIETILLSGFAAAFACRYSPYSVLMAAVTTAVLTLLLTLFAFQTKIDLTGYTGVIFVALIAVIVMSLIGGILFPLLIGISIPYLHLIISCVMVVIICALIILHTQMLMRDKQLSLDPSMYCFGASTLFFDIIYLFIYLLQIFGRED